MQVYRLYPGYLYNMNVLFLLPAPDTDGFTGLSPGPDSPPR